MKLFTAEQIRHWDAYTIEHEPISSIQLMERAANACFIWLQQHLLCASAATGAPKELSVKVFCGKGNNGADGLAIAKLLIKNHFKPSIYILDIAPKGSKDFEPQLEQLQSLSKEIHFISKEILFPAIENSELVIDALFGTGLSKPLEGLAAEWVKNINQCKATIVSIDLPSGMFADKTSKGLPMVNASYCLSFQNYKTCLLMAENAASIGEIVLLDIGLHPEFESKEPVNFQVTDQELIQTIYRPRKIFAHKGNYGHALIVAGSYGKMGAAQLSAKACLRSGVGLLTVHVPVLGYSILQMTTPESMVITGDIAFPNNYKTIGIGPGLGTSEEAVKLLTDIIENCKTSNAYSGKPACPLIIDADALNILSMHPALLSKLPAECILTPHPKEFERLFGKTENDFDALQMALQKAAEFRCYIILKGHHSFIATPEGKGYFNNTGNAGMATGGSGDVLTGILTGLSAQEYRPLETCLLGVYLHGLSGDIAATQFSQEAMLASDITQCLGEAFKRIS
jgi:NAD(P)H-hydrate epimerase